MMHAITYMKPEDIQSEMREAGKEHFMIPHKVTGAVRFITIERMWVRG